MNNVELEYSYSGGQYWSKYPHCKVFENGTYNVIVKDNYGQTTTAQIEVSNNKKTVLTPPNVLLGNSKGMYQEYTWSPEPVSVQMSGGKYFVDYKLETDSEWTLGDRVQTSIVNIGHAGKNNLLVRTRDSYGNTSFEFCYPIWIDTTGPTNLNFVPHITYGNEIITTVTAIEDVSLPMRYSITYDDGKTWSKPQLGEQFTLINPPHGTYTINCRAYNGAGLYVEGIAVEVVITDTIH